MSVMTMTAVSPERLNGERDEFLERSLCLCTYMQHSFRGWKDIPEAGLARNPEAPMCGSLSNLFSFRRGNFKRLQQTYEFLPRFRRGYHKILGWWQ